MKTCTKCEQVKPMEEFRKRAAVKSGRAAQCKTCSYAALKAWRGENVAHVREQCREYYSRNSARCNANTAQWKRDNYDAVRESIKTRRAAKVTAIPAWADRIAIREVYAQARAWNSIWPDDPVHVDHIVPLVSELVCGLHVPANLQILRAGPNMSKGNRFWPDMP
jgi:hypothetical protein